nr:MAG TPA: hypothetical protein [Caudoviricetes sp.]
MYEKGQNFLIFCKGKMNMQIIGKVNSDMARTFCQY